MAAGSNVRRTTSAHDSIVPMISWPNPQAWKSGAATTVVSSARQGSRPSIAGPSEPPPPAARLAPLGVPVVPEVSRMTLDLRRVRTGRCPACRAISVSTVTGCSAGSIGPRHDACDVRKVAQRRIHDGAELLVVDDDVGAFPRHHLREGRTGERRVQQQHVRADPLGGGECVDEPAMVAAHDAHHPRCPTGQLLQCGRERVGPGVELPIAQHTEFVDQRGTVRAALRRHAIPTVFVKPS